MGTGPCSSHFAVFVFLHFDVLLADLIFLHFNKLFAVKYMLTEFTAYSHCRL